MRLALLLALLLWAPAQAAITWVGEGHKTEFSGNLEGQARWAQNPDVAQDPPLLQDWDNEAFHLASANLTLKTTFSASRLEANWYTRYAASKLFKGKQPFFPDGWLAARVYNFPNRLVARQLVDLTYEEQTKSDRVDTLLNKFYYEWDTAEARFALGRLFINYGQGEVFNPINPFNQPLGLAGQTNVAQGNDGARAAFFLSGETTLELFVLGDKQLEENDDSTITPTGWLRLEHRFPTWQVELVGGHDQKRRKAGGQLNVPVGGAMVFIQALYSSAPDGEDGEDLLDALAGYDHQLNADWHLRLEGGYQEEEDDAALSPQTLEGRLLPFEKFLALANSWETHPLVELSATLIHDLDTQFGYGVARLRWSLYENWEWDFFAFAPVWEKRASEGNLVQNLITRDVGTALRVFF